MYALNDYEEKLAFWAKLLELGSQCQGPWPVVGDFNMVSSQVEKQGVGCFVPPFLMGCLT